MWSWPIPVTEGIWHVEQHADRKNPVQHLNFGVAWTDTKCWYKWNLYGFSNLQTKKIYTTASRPSTWSPQSGTPGTAMLSSSGLMASKRRTQPAATGRITSVSEYSPVCCQEDNQDPLPQKLLSQIKNYRLKSNSQPVFFHSLSTGAILDKGSCHKENCV